MAARRPRKSERGVKDFDALLDAIKAIKVFKRSRKSTAKAYNIDMRSLGRYVQKFDAAVPDITAVADDELLKVVRQIASYSTPSLVFNEEQENMLLEYVLKCAQHYYGLSVIELKQLAYQFALKIKAEYPRSWDKNKMAGKQWYYNFMLRHQKVPLLTPEQTRLNSGLAFWRENVNHFFRNLNSILVEKPLTANSIWNMDEIGFSTLPNRMGEIVTLKDVKRVSQITTAEHGIITLAFAASASGNSIPPFYLFPTKNMDPLYLTHTSKETVGFANESGLMQQADFVKFMKHFIKHSHSSKSSPTLLLLDNHGSHLSVEAIDMAVENGVTMLSFPPHCSHWLQPLDVSVHRRVKGSYNQAYKAWMRNNAGKTLDMALILEFVEKALLQGATAENIMAGFKATGICPYDAEVFDKLQEANAGASAVERENDQNERRRMAIDSTSSDSSI